MQTKIVELMAKKQAETRKIIDVATLVNETGLSRPTVTAWVKGRVTRFNEDTIVAFCRYFDCDVGNLLTVIDDEKGEL